MNLLKTLKEAREFLLDGNFVYPTQMLTNLTAAIEQIEKAEPVVYLCPHCGTGMEIDPTAKHSNTYPPDAQAEIERLHQVCRNAYEVWAGSEGIPQPETAPEAYPYRLLIEMRDEVKKGLK